MFVLQKTETESRKLRFRFTRALQTLWEPGRSKSVTDYVRPTRATGFEYECTTAGQTGSREPKWPTTLAGTVTDGSVVWTARAFGTNALDTISSVTGQAPAGVTLSTPQIDGDEVTADISGGADGGAYIISVEATTASGEILEEKVRVEVVGE